MVTADQVWEVLAEIPDPEIPVISLVDLGVVKGVAVENGTVRVDFTPTFMGCPALEVMQGLMAEAVRSLRGEPEVVVVAEEGWTSDRITPEGRRRLRASGFAPPPPLGTDDNRLLPVLSAAECPYCGSRNTTLDNPFGPTLCRAIYHCADCRQPFEQFKAV